jgi:hypothetical protein
MKIKVVNKGSVKAKPAGRWCPFLVDAPPESAK